MGIDVHFYKQSRSEFGYFNNRIFKDYFRLEESQNDKDIIISKTIFQQFIRDLSLELLRKNDLYIPGKVELVDIIPVNERLRYSATGKYDIYFWTNLDSIFHWAANVNSLMNWETDRLVMRIWW